MTVLPLTIELASVCFLTFWVLWSYSNIRKQHPLTTIVTFVAWYFSFVIVFILPLDIGLTFYHQCSRPSTSTFFDSAVESTESSSGSDDEGSGMNASTLFPAEVTTPQVPEQCDEPWDYVPREVLLSLWKVVYWTSQFLTWLCIPLMQSYSSAGDFTVLGKIKASLFENALWYASYLFIFGILLIYVATKSSLSGENLKVVLITASNTWGLCLLVLLLGYGLVELPRSYWLASKANYTLNHTYFRVAKVSIEKSDADEMLDDVLEDVRRVAGQIRSTHPLRPHIETILNKCPESIRNSARRFKSDEENPRLETPTTKSMARLHKRLIYCVRTQHRTQCQWEVLLEKAFDQEDVHRNMSNLDRRFQKTFPNTAARPAILRYLYSPSVEWYWRCAVTPSLLKIITGLFVLMSAMVIWSEMVFFSREPVLSLFAIFINLANTGLDYIYMEIISFITIAYLSCCAYYTIFKVRVLNYYYLESHHMTDENSLLFSGLLLCRLTPPLCLNFLGLIHLDSHITLMEGTEETAYTKIMGHMDVLKIIANGFNIYFPMGIVVLCLLTYFNLGTRLLHCLGFEQFIGDDDLSQELVEEGRNLISREKRRRQHVQEGEARRRDWRERFDRSSRERREAMGVAGAGMHARSTPPSGDGTSVAPGSTSSKNDRTELLRDAEPVDYTNDDFFTDFDAGIVRPSDSVSGNRLPSRIFDDI